MVALSFYGRFEARRALLKKTTTLAKDGITRGHKNRLLSPQWLGLYNHFTQHMKALFSWLFLVIFPCIFWLPDTFLCDMIVKSWSMFQELLYFERALEELS